MRYIKTYKIFESQNSSYIDGWLNVFNSFLERGIKNEWLSFGPIHIYVRRSKRKPIGQSQLLDFIDLATIEIDIQNQKIFTNLIERLLNDYRFNIFVESIMDKRLADFLERNGFLIDDSQKIIYNAYYINEK